MQNQPLDITCAKDVQRCCLVAKATTWHTSIQNTNVHWLEQPPAHNMFSVHHSSLYTNNVSCVSHHCDDRLNACVFTTGALPKHIMLPGLIIYFFSWNELLLARGWIKQGMCLLCAYSGGVDQDNGKCDCYTACRLPITDLYIANVNHKPMTDLGQWQI